MGAHFISNYSAQPSQVLSIYSIYIPSPIIEVEVLYTSPHDIIRGTILSIVVTKWLKTLLTRVAVIEIALYYST